MRITDVENFAAILAYVDIWTVDMARIQIFTICQIEISICT